MVVPAGLRYAHVLSKRRAPWFAALTFVAGFAKHQDCMPKVLSSLPSRIL